MSEINRVGVVGCGLMGAGIAEVSARAGKDVLVVESTRVAADVGRARLASKPSAMLRRRSESAMCRARSWQRGTCALALWWLR